MPNVPVIKTAKLFHQSGFKIYVLSGRSDKTKKVTAQWLVIDAGEQLLCKSRVVVFEKDGDD